MGVQEKALKLYPAEEHWASIKSPKTNDESLCKMFRTKA